MFIKTKWYANNRVPLGVPLGLESFCQNLLFSKEQGTIDKVLISNQNSRRILINYYKILHSPVLKKNL